MNDKIKQEALQRIIDKKYFDDMRERARLRSQKVVDKYKDSDPLTEEIKATNEGADIINKGMSEEEKEAAAERDYLKKRREMGLS